MGDSVQRTSQVREKYENLVAVAFAPFFAEPVLVEEDLGLVLVTLLLLRSVFLVIWLEDLPVDLTKWYVVFLIQVLHIVVSNLSEFGQACTYDFTEKNNILSSYKIQPTLHLGEDVLVIYPFYGILHHEVRCKILEQRVEIVHTGWGLTELVVRSQYTLQLSTVSEEHQHLPWDGMCVVASAGGGW